MTTDNIDHEHNTSKPPTTKSLPPLSRQVDLLPPGAPSPLACHINVIAMHIKDTQATGTTTDTNINNDAQIDLSDLESKALEIVKESIPSMKKSGIWKDSADMLLAAVHLTLVPKVLRPAAVEILEACNLFVNPRGLIQSRHCVAVARCENGWRDRSKGFSVRNINGARLDTGDRVPLTVGKLALMRKRREHDELDADGYAAFKRRVLRLHAGSDTRRFS